MAQLSDQLLQSLLLFVPRLLRDRGLFRRGGRAVERRPRVAPGAGPRVLGARVALLGGAVHELARVAAPLLLSCASDRNNASCLMRVVQAVRV